MQLSLQPISPTHMRVLTGCETEGWGRAARQHSSSGPTLTLGRLRDGGPGRGGKVQVAAQDGREDGLLAAERMWVGAQTGCRG